MTGPVRLALLALLAAFAFPLASLAAGDSGGGSDGKVSVGDVTVAEGDDGTTYAEFELTSKGAPKKFTVEYETSDGSATAPDDYEETSGTQVVEGDAHISVPIAGDKEKEDDETFTLKLSTRPAA